MFPELATGRARRTSRHGDERRGASSSPQSPVRHSRRLSSEMEISSVKSRAEHTPRKHSTVVRHYTTRHSHTSHGTRTGLPVTHAGLLSISDRGSTDDSRYTPRIHTPHSPLRTHSSALNLTGCHPPTHHTGLCCARVETPAIQGTHHGALDRPPHGPLHQASHSVPPRQCLTPSDTHGSQPRYSLDTFPRGSEPPLQAPHRELSLLRYLQRLRRDGGAFAKTREQGLQRKRRIGI